MRKVLLPCLGLVLLSLGIGGSSLYKPVSLDTEPYLLEYPANFGKRFTIPEDNPLTKQGVYLGRMLFYETRLSTNNTISCHSCHQQSLAFTDGRKFSIGVDGTLTKRNAMSLANLLWVRNFFWDGRTQGLEAQATFPLTDPHEMGQTLEESAIKLAATPVYPPLFKAAFGSESINGDRITKALAQFERTLISAGSRYDQYLKGTYTPTAAELHGLNLFFTAPDPKRKIRGANCGHCHGGAKTYIELFHNNGLDSQVTDSGREQITGNTMDKGRFRVVTLRNIALTAPYMHDGRFNTLEDVINHYSEHVQPSATLSTFIKGVSNEPDGDKLHLTATEKQDLLAFLHMLTDSTFIRDERFSDPHSSAARK